MNKKLRFGLLILLIFGLQTVIGVVFIKPYIFTWGATDQEVSMSMPGDHLAPFISSTRGISINAPISDALTRIFFAPLLVTKIPVMPVFGLMRK